MTGIVGASAIRTDLLPGLSKRTTTLDGILEQGLPIRLDDIAQPTDRSTTLNVKTLADFYELFGKIMDAAREYDGLEYPLAFSKEFPPIETSLPCFTAALISREPYSVKGRREMGARFMEEVPDEDFPGDILEIHQRRQFNVVKITVWAKTSKVCSELAEWVEDKFFENLWLFQWCGLSHPVEWIGRERDIKEEVREQTLFGAPMTFRVVTSKITKKRATMLRQIGLKIGLLVSQDIREEISKE